MRLWFHKLFWPIACEGGPDEYEKLHGPLSHFISSRVCDTCGATYLLDLQSGITFGWQKAKRNT